MQISNSIYVLTDVFRPGDMALKHAQFIKDLFEQQIAVASGHNLEIPPFELGSNIFKNHSLPENESTWAAAYENISFGREYVQALSWRLQRSFVIGFEIPPCITYALDEAGIFYLNMIQHPLRFLDDVFFGIQSNSEPMREILRLQSMHEKLPALFAGLRRATVRKFAASQVEEGATLVICQTDVDRSLIQGGRLLNWDQFASRLLEIGQSAPAVYIKPHPYGSGASLETIIRFIPSAKVRYENIYSWLVDDRVVDFVGLTSGSLIEAASFGKKATFLSDYPLNVERPHDKDYYFPIYDGILGTSFWQKIMQSFDCNVYPVECHIPFHKNRLRTAFSQFYGYNFLDTDIQLWSSDVIQDLLRGQGKVS